MNTFLAFLIQFFRQPAIVIGLVALIGLIVQRKSWQEVASGTLKTILGILAFTVGAGAIVSNLTPVTNMIVAAFNLEGVYPHDIVLTGSIAAKFGTEVGLILGIGFLVNLIVARFTPFKYVFLTGHYMFIYAAAWTAVLNSIGLRSTIIVVLGSIIQGLFSAIFPALTQPLVRKAQGENMKDSFALGHGHVIGTLLGIGISSLFGKDEKKLDEDVEVSPTGALFRDMSVSMTLVMLVLVFVASIAAGPSVVESEISNGQNWILFGLLTALGFTAGVLVLLYGVRLFLGEIVPAFKGIATKIVPGAIPALDIPVIFPFGPAALTAGFLMGVVGQGVAILVCGLLSLPIPIPSMIPAFFISGGAAILANHWGGRRAAYITGFVWSFVDFIAASLVYNYDVFGVRALGISGQTFHSLDAMTVGTLIKLIGSLFGGG